jgi:hypothetical protein
MESLQVFTAGDTDPFKVDKVERTEYNALGMTEPLCQKYILNIEQLDDISHILKTDKETFRNQLLFALKPKLSGNVDLRLNRLNLRKIERVVKTIKFS